MLVPATDQRFLAFPTGSSASDFALRLCIVPICSPSLAHATLPGFAVCRFVASVPKALSPRREQYA
jgi:hypothetical protein